MDMKKIISGKSLKLNRPSFLILVLVWTILTLLPIQVRADKNPVEEKIPAVLNSGLHHFLDLVDPEKNVPFDPQLVAAVMAFIESPKQDDALYFADEILGMPSAYYEFDSHTDLQKVAAYAFNPDIPAIATMPSSVRIFHWLDEKGHRSQSPPVNRYLDNLNAPVMEKALQYVEITPDTNSGAYYAYNLYQTLIVFKYRQRKVLITISKQTDVSTVGKKGYVLGSDDDWDYLYSGEKGLTIPALGWISSYMYASSAINIYYEIDPESPKVRCAMFKWLRAGWSDINMVKRIHIYKGLKRFAKPFKEIMENPLLPPVSTLAAGFAQIERFPDETLKSKMHIYADILRNRYSGGDNNAEKRASKLLANKNHWSGMSREEMLAALVIEYMKAAVGKTLVDETGQLFDSDMVQRIHGSTLNGFGEKL